MISFLARGRCSQGSTRLFSLIESARVVGNLGIFRIHTICSSRHRKTVNESFFIKPKLRIIYAPEDKTVEHISEIGYNRGP
jgi:hypothetical protein